MVDLEGAETRAHRAKGWRRKATSTIEFLGLEAISGRLESLNSDREPKNENAAGELPRRVVFHEGYITPKATRRQIYF